MESCPRGRRCSTRNAVYVMYLGFESLTLRQSKKQVVRPAFAFAKQKRDSNKEGADLSAEENSPVDCFCRRGQGAKRREGIRQYAEKIPNSPPKKACKQASLQAFFLTTSSKSLHTFDCFPSAAEIHRFRQSHTVYHSTCRR